MASSKIGTSLTQSPTQSTDDAHIKLVLKVVFIPYFNVKIAQHTPAADLSEQIATDGMET